MQDPNQKKKKKKYGRKVAFACCCVLLAAMLLNGLDIGGFGSGLGIPFAGALTGDGDDSDADDQQDVDAPDLPEYIGFGDRDEQDESIESVDPAVPPRLIIVAEDRVYYDDAVVSLDELRTVLENRITTEPNTQWELRSEHPIVATINGVRDLLRDLGVDFSETTG